MRRLFGGLAGTLFLALALSTAVGVLATAGLAGRAAGRAAGQGQAGTGGNLAR